MWRCPTCGSYNEDRSRQCAGCGAQKPPSAPSGASSRAGRPKLRRWVTVLLIFLLAGLVLTLKISFIHIWAGATCTTPRTCIICGKTSGSPLIHDWLPADCTHPHICRRCGADDGKPLGHQWQVATFDAPKTCLRCGAQEGEPLSVPGELPSHWGDDLLTDFGDNVSTYALILDEPLRDCRGITLTISIELESGSPFGSWYLCAQSPDGRWDRVAEFALDYNASYIASYALSFDAPLDFDAVAIVPKDDLEYAMSYYLILSNPR